MNPGGGQKEQRRKPGGRRMTPGGAQEEPGRRQGNLCAQQTSALHLYMVRRQALTMRHQHCSYAQQPSALHLSMVRWQVPAMH